MSVITTGNIPKALVPGVAAFWGRSYDEHPQEWKNLFDTETSTRNYEEDVQLTGFGFAPVKAQGSSISYDSEVQGYVTRYTHVVYGLGYVVTKEEEEDGQYMEVSKRRVQALAFSMRQTKEVVGANVYNRAFSTSYPIGDAAALLSAAHPTEAGNQSNILSVAADLSEASLEDMLIQVSQAKNHKGHNIKLIGKTLIVAPANMFEAARILKSLNQSGTANNDVNAIRALGLLPGGVVVNHYLTDSDAWFVRTNAPRGLLHWQRRAIAFGPDNDFDTENMKFKATERYSFGATDWRGLYGSAGA